MRFYKGAGNTGTHVGNLWSSSGTLLATATFSGESASGWQQVTFSSPVAVTANTTYVASYFAPNGHYSSTNNGLASAVDNAPLHALAGRVVGRQRRLPYGASSAFPNASYQNTNYWVDAVFTDVAGPDTTPPTVTATTPTRGATGVATSATPSATFSEAVQSGTISFTLHDAAQRGGRRARRRTTRPRTSATFTPVGARWRRRDVHGDRVAARRTPRATRWRLRSSWSFTTAAAAAACPCHDLVGGCDAGGRRDRRHRCGRAGREVPLRRRRLRHRRAVLQGRGQHGDARGEPVVVDGTLLATATFSGESASGWQQVTFSSPVAITANTTYVASYFAPNGHYASTNNGLRRRRSTTLRSTRWRAHSGGNGVYRYGVELELPDRQLPEHELLGRRGVRDGVTARRLRRSGIGLRPERGALAEAVVEWSVSGTGPAPGCPSPWCRSCARSA